MFCEHCGTKLETDSKFCTNCGKSTSEPPVPVVNNTIIEETEPLSTITETPEPTEISFENHSDALEEIPDEPIEIINEDADLSDAFNEPVPEDIPQYEPAYNDEFSTPEPEYTAEEISTFSEPYTEPAPDYSDSFASGEIDSFGNTAEIPVASEADVTQADASLNLYNENEFAQENAPESIPEGKNYAESEEFNVEEKAYTGVSGGRKFGAILLMPFILVFLILFNTVTALRFSLSGESVNKAYNKIDFDEFLATNLHGDTTLLSYIYDNLDDNLKKNYDVKKKNVQSFAEKADLKGYTGNILGQYIDLIVLGDGSPAYTAEDLSDFVKSNDEIIKDEFGYKIKKKDYSELEASFNDMKISKYLIPANWKKEIGFDFRYTYLVIYIALAVSLIFTVMLMIWQSLILTKKGGIVTAYLGFAFIFGGIVSVAPIAYMLLTYGSSNTVLYLTGNLLMPSLPFFAVIGGVELVAGIILSIVGKKLRNKTVKKQPVTE